MSLYLSLTWRGQKSAHWKWFTQLVVALDKSTTQETPNASPQGEWWGQALGCSLHGKGFPFWRRDGEGIAPASVWNNVAHTGPSNHGRKRQMSTFPELCHQRHLPFPAYTSMAIMLNGNHTESYWMVIGTSFQTANNLHICLLPQLIGCSTCYLQSKSQLIRVSFRIS